jgi:hypothetical protein
MKSINLILVWLCVVLPLGWGVMKSVQKSLPLFGITSAAPAAPGK